MVAERSVLVGIRRSPLEASLRKAIAANGHRSTRVQTVEDCRSLVQRRVFLAAFLDRGLFHQISKQCPFRTPTYKVLMVEPREISKALELQKADKIHDWLAAPIESCAVHSLLTRAKSFSRMASELEAIRQAAEKTIRRDATLLCSGRWASSATEWIDRVKNGMGPLLLAGEAGCGKRLLARLLHVSSPRASGPFVMIRCRDEKPERLEREIFGDIPPRNRPPKTTPIQSQLLLADNGTILIDKAEHLPRRIQQRLARAIRTGEFSPVGGGETLQLQARVIFTIQEDTKRSVSKMFHSDLARLLKRSVLRIPSLRERKEDLPIIVQCVLEKIRREYGVRPSGTTEGALDLLKKHHWPGNIRELEGILWAASVFAGPKSISLQAVIPFLPNSDNGIANEELALEEVVEKKLADLFRRFDVDHLKNLHPMVLERVERPLLKLMLDKTKGSQTKAAQLLGINRNTLRRKLTQYGIR